MKEGYKQTEVGVIPENWEVKELGELLKIRHGKNQKEVEVIDGKYQILGTGGEIGRTNDYLYSKPSVLIGRKGTIDAPRYMDTPFWTVDTLFYSEIAKNTNPKFIYYKFCLIDWYSYNEASGVPSLNTSTIENIKQSIPKNKKEQKAIAKAKALSDVDALIEAQEKLIAKKQAIKTATMQQLLTGKKRLGSMDNGEWRIDNENNPDDPLPHTQTTNPPYKFKKTELGEIPEDWEVKSYGEIFTFLTTASNSRADLSDNENVKYIHYGDIHTKWDFLLDIQTNDMPSISPSKINGAAFLKHGDLVMADASEDYEGIGKSIEIKCSDNEKIISGLHTFLLRDIDKSFVDGYQQFRAYSPSLQINKLQK